MFCLRHTSRLPVSSKVPSVLFFCACQSVKYSCVAVVLVSRRHYGTGFVANNKNQQRRASSTNSGTTCADSDAVALSMLSLSVLNDESCVFVLPDNNPQKASGTDGSDVFTAELEMACQNEEKRETIKMSKNTAPILDDVAIADAQELEQLNKEDKPESEHESFLLPESKNTTNPKCENKINRREWEEATAVVPVSEKWLTHMSGPSSYVSQQDALYLAAPTPFEARLPTAATSPKSPCVLVVFAANDMRVHDNYTLALAALLAEAAGGLPVIAVAVVDCRTFAQPSAVGAFFRQSPMRARFFLDTLASLRAKVEGELHVPLLIRFGRPEEHIPRLAVECGATDVFLTTQYAPHEKYVHDTIITSIKARKWVSRDAASGFLTQTVHDATLFDPYGCSKSSSCGSGVTENSSKATAAPVLHSVWQTTLVHIDDLPVPVVSMAEGERWYHDDVSIANIRRTEPYDRYIAKLKSLPTRHELLPSVAELRGLEPPPAYRGCIPTLEQLGYSNPEAFVVEEVIATQSSHPPGEDAAIRRVENWLSEGGMTSMLRYGRERRTNTKMYSQRLSRVSPYLSNGSLSPRRFYEMLRTFASENIRDNFVQMQFREALLRLSRRDFWHWMGLRYKAQLFYSYGPRPEQTDNIPAWRHDKKIVQKWCAGLTGIPFADAAMHELLTTGFVAHEGRQALAWLLTRGYGQDWRLGAEWLERCSLDYDPFLCYGNFAYFSGLLVDDFGEPVRSVHWLAHHHDQTGIYVKKWLPVLSKIPPVYIHRPHVLTPRMQAMHGVSLGKNYPYPLKLWDGAQYTLGSDELTTYFDDSSKWHNKVASGAGGAGYSEALRHGKAIMKVEEWNAAMSTAYVACRPWVHHLPASAFESSSSSSGNEAQEVDVVQKTKKSQEQKKHELLQGQSCLT